MPYHYVLTLIKGAVTSTRAGVVNIHEGDTRDEALRMITENCFPGEYPNLTILFFSLEPNQLL